MLRDDVIPYIDIVFKYLQNNITIQYKIKHTFIKITDINFIK